MSQQFEFGNDATTDLRLATLLLDNDAITDWHYDCSVADRNYRFGGYCNTTEFEDWAIFMLSVGYDSDLLCELASARELERERANRVFQAILESFGIADIADRMRDWERWEVDAYLTGTIGRVSLLKIGQKLANWVYQKRPTEDLLHNWDYLEAAGSTVHDHESESVVDDIVQRRLQSDRKSYGPSWEAARIPTRLLNTNLWIDEIVKSHRNVVQSNPSRHRVWAEEMLSLGLECPSLSDLAKLPIDSSESRFRTTRDKTLDELNLAHLPMWPTGDITMYQVLVERCEMEAWTKSEFVQVAQFLADRTEHMPFEFD